MKEFSKAIKSSGGICVFVNREEASSNEWKGVFDYQGALDSASETSAELTLPCSHSHRQLG